MIAGDCNTLRSRTVPAVYWVELGSSVALQDMLSWDHPSDTGYAKAVNNSGVVAGYFNYDDPPGLTRSFLWIDGVMTEIENGLGGDMVRAEAISNTGFVVGNARTSLDLVRAMRYDIHTGEMITLGDGIAYDVNDRGVAVGASITSGYLAALLYKDDEVIDLIPHLPSYMLEGNAFGINNYGWIVGEARDENVNNYAWLLVPVYSKGDYDGDEDVDLHDFGHFQRCYAAEPYQGPEGGLHVGCSVFDFDDDVDLDLADFAAFQAALTGPTAPDLNATGPG